MVFLLTIRFVFFGVSLGKTASVFRHVLIASVIPKTNIGF